MILHTKHLSAEDRRSEAVEAVIDHAAITIPKNLPPVHV
jgi:hypothetical protein